MAPSDTTTREASASRRAAARVLLSAEGVGNEAMDELPGMRRLSALRPRGEGAPGQSNRVPAGADILFQVVGRHAGAASSVRTHRRGESAMWLKVDNDR
ncbi:hypothetical protein GCM10010273_44280 [Streptomyces lavendulocolor]